ncbi:hypothetical protein Tco_0977366 [Tanacetum coccineum]|uniref:Uncharacterized protein n=1 Tax=Tanacetum coccineum TaxID=301880 RepID=A0ABQ5EJY3_9ASTR
MRQAVLNQAMAVAVVVPCTGSSEAYIVNNDTPTTKDKNGSLAELLVLHLTPISSMKSAQSGFLNVRLFMTRLLCTYLFSIVTEQGSKTQDVTRSDPQFNDHPLGGEY